MADLFTTWTPIQIKVLSRSIKILDYNDLT